jgi:hypothetical protein
MASVASYLTQNEHSGDRGALQVAWFTGDDIAVSATTIAAWDDLACHASEPNAFCESWYLRPALKAFQEQSSVRLFTVWQGAPRNSELLGLIPLVEHSVYAGLPVPYYQNWLHPNAFLGSPLVRKGYEEAFWRVLLSEIDEQVRSTLFLHLNAMNAQGALHQALERICAQDGRHIALVNSKSRAILQSGLNPQEYLEAAVRGKKRKELRRQHSRLAELGDLRFARLDGSGGLDNWTQEFLALERRGWKGANGSALDCQDDTRALFTEALKGAAALGKLELLELRLNGAPLAMLVNFLSVPGAFSFKTAFDEDYARFSPGVLLQIENLALLERSDIDWCDSCAAEGHPMIDSLWSERRQIGRYSVAIGGKGRRALFGLMLHAELAKMKWRSRGNSKQNLIRGQAV